MSDLISRQTVLELLQMKYFGKDLYKAIYELPSANAISIDQANAMIKSYVSHYEENKAEWVLDYRDCGVEFYHCSKCNLGRAVIDGDYYKSLDEFKKCPICGCQMNKENNNVDE